MGPRHAHRLFIAALAPGLALILAAMAPGCSQASGPSASAPWYLDPYGGEQADMEKVWSGRPGLVMARAPRPMLFMEWRLLHRLKLGREAGAALSVPCCDAHFDPAAPPSGPSVWREIRKSVPGLEEPPYYFSTYRAEANFDNPPNCFDEAFETAAATLKDRAQRFGLSSEPVRAWTQTQDAVFKACGEAKVALPAPMPRAPDWLKRDRAYQEAAFALYNQDFADAARRFSAIGRDTGSPWRPFALYLTTRTLVRDALFHPAPAAYATAHQALDALGAAPKGTFGQGKLKDLHSILAFHEHPAEQMARLEQVLSQADPIPNMDVTFRDLTDLSDARPPRAEALAWMATMKAAPYRGDFSPAPPQTAADAHEDATAARARETADALATLELARQKALAHAAQVWTERRDSAWLLAALTLLNPADRDAAALIAAAERTPEESPAWLTLQYHLIRLSLVSAPPKTLRARLDALLARDDLSMSERSLFQAQRLQVASDLKDFARFALRRRLCGPDKADALCVRNAWPLNSVQYGGVFDGEGDHGASGLGEDARAIIDRLPLAQRISLALDPIFPEKIRLDIALTSYARAVALQDSASVDRLAFALTLLLPVLRTEFQQVLLTPLGPDKRFAEFLILAKIPGLKPDLIDYERPEGAPPQFAGHWSDLILYAKGGGVTDARPAPQAAYQTSGVTYDLDLPDPGADLTCLGECGRGAAPLRLPDFVEALQAKAQAERPAFPRRSPGYYSAGETNPPVTSPPGAVSVWEEMLSYIQAHPSDERAPEALYWLVHVGHFGGSHNHSGRRAFRLLHSRHPTSDWAKKTKFYYD